MPCSSVAAYAADPRDGLPFQEMRSLILRFGQNEAQEASPGARLVQLVPGTPGTNQVTWQPGSEVPVDEILLG